MAYSTADDLEDTAAGGGVRLLDLADWDNAGTIDAAVTARIDAAIAWADGRINLYARMRYATPFSSPTPEIVQLSAELAVYKLKKNRGQLSPEDIREFNEELMPLLKDLAGGLARPDEPTPTATVSDASEWIDHPTAADDPCGTGVSREDLKGGAW